VSRGERKVLLIEVSNGKNIMALHFQRSPIEGKNAFKCLGVKGKCVVLTGLKYTEVVSLTVYPKGLRKEGDGVVY